MIYKITSAQEWDQAQNVGHFAGSKDDLRDGFVHFSTARQVKDTAAKYFSHQTGLVLIAVDEGRLEKLKWEPSRGGDLFPHLYAALPVSAAEWIAPLTLDGDGTPIIPDGLLRC